MLNLQTELKAYLGYTRFRPGQEEILNALLQQRSALAILPTGGGKSLLYQMMGHLRPGLVIIISPLLSLMQDQVARLNYTGEKQVVALNSTLDRKERQQVLQQLHTFKFLFISPEMLADDQVQTQLQNININLLVIDEAHTMLSWGPDFRPEYLRLPQLHEKLQRPQLLLLTATATPAMSQQMLDLFRLKRPDTFVYQTSIDRANIFLNTEKLSNETEKEGRLTQLVERLKGPGIVYVSSRKLANSMARRLTVATGLRVVAYHAGLDYYTRYRIQRQFMLDQIDVIIATSAFGMGLNKSDIRYVIHYQLSSDLTNYLQEFGRAGRDDQPALAILLYAPGDELLQSYFIDLTLPEPATVALISKKSSNTESINENQVNLVKYYLEQGQTVTQINQQFEKRRQQRLLALNQLVKYINLEQGLRRYILEAFQDESEFKVDQEAANQPVDWQKFARQKPIVTESDFDQMQPWSDKLRQLFNIK
ncbi:ATP-dependent DNA helicase RecQ [Weissella coleopterorum]|uniref:ATP-dependent DNA helicase RecQ n=1 Tax=Weissella coleopterorum TaxID=2714949 RepID=A0A6G8B0T3_9LACO|nr:RecQ family ATP-dependent DNA helicase [Weissella coleopterorum]QIL50825.1 ATP-dependent DNA helicase RecQ [Weissella coleopterorum]